MKKISLSILALFLSISLSFAQNNLNAYKYIIVPKNYEFLKGEDKYQVNSLTKFLFKKKGYNTVFEGDTYPKDLNENPCLGITTNVIDDSRLFTTKLNIELIDCYNKVIYTSIQGSSRKKEYKPAHHEALRNAFVSIENMDYQYSPALVINKKNITSPSKAPKAITIPETSVVETEEIEVDNIEASARSFSNDKLSFLLVKQSENLVAYVNDSKDKLYKKGEKIAVITKSSTVGIFHVKWKNNEGQFIHSIGSFDKDGNLKVDIEHDGKIETKIFNLE